LIEDMCVCASYSLLSCIIVLHRVSARVASWCVKS